MASRYWVGGGATANWTENTAGVTNWATTSGGVNTAAVPTSSDDVFFDNGEVGAPHNATFDTSSSVNSIDFTGYTGTFTHSASKTLTVAGTTVVCKLVAGMTYTLGSVTTSKFSFNATSGTVSFTTAGKTIASFTKSGVGGTLKMIDALVMDSTATLTLTSGTFDANDQNVTVGKISSTNTNTREFKMGSGTWDINGTGTVWTTADMTGCTITASTSTIQFSDSSASARTFSNGSAAGTPGTFATFKITAGSGTFTQTSITGSSAATLKCSDFNTTGYTGSYIRGVDGAGITISGSMTLGTGMTFTNLGGTITFSSTASGKTITSNSVNLNNTGTIEFNGVGGVWTLQDALLSDSSTLTLTNGTLDTNGKSVTMTGQFNGNNSNTKTLTLGASVISVGSWQLSATGTTFNSNTSAITASGNTITLGVLTYYNFTCTGAVPAITGGATFNNLTFTGSNILTQRFNVGATLTVNGTFTVTGFSQTARAFVYTATYRQAQTISAATTTFTNVDFQDITAAGAGSWSGTSVGNAFGNTGITFTGAVTRYWVGNGGNLSDTTHWSTSSGGASGASMPLPQDTANFDANSFSSGSQTVVKDIFYVPIVNFTGVTNTPAFNCYVNVGSNGGFYGSMTFVSGMTLTGSTTQTFRGRGSHTLTTNTLSLPQSLTIDNNAGTLSLGDNLTLTSPKILTLTSGTFNANNFNVTIDTFSSNNTNTRTVTMGSGTWDLQGSGVIWSMADTTGATVTANTSTVQFSYSGASTRTYQNASTGGSAATIGNFKITAGSSTFTITQGGSSALKVADFDTTGYTGTFTYSTNTINISGSMTIGSGSLMSGSGTITMSSTASGKTITTNGATLSTSPLTFNGVGGVWTLGSDLTLGSTVALTLTNGAFDTGGYAVSIGNFSSSNSNIRTLTITNSTITLGGVNTVWTTSTTTNLTFTATGSTIKITDTSATAKTWTGGSLTYGTLWFAKGTGTSTDTLNGSNTFSTLKNDGTVAWLLKFANSSTTTIASAGGWQMSGIASNLLSMTSVTAATAWNLSVASGNVSCDYVSLKDSHAAGGASFYAGSHSTDVSGNTGWSFTDAPVGSSSNFLMLF